VTVLQHPPKGEGASSQGELSCEVPLTHSFSSKHLRCPLPQGERATFLRTAQTGRILMKCQIPRQHGLGMRSGACAAARTALGWSIRSSCHRARRQRMSRRKNEIRQSRRRSDRFQLPAPADQVRVQRSRCGHSDGRRSGSEVRLEQLALRFERGLLAGAELGSQAGRRTTRDYLVDVPLPPVLTLGPAQESCVRSNVRI
jgi:hypothetical protein